LFSFIELIPCAEHYNTNFCYWLEISQNFNAFILKQNKHGLKKCTQNHYIKRSSQIAVTANSNPMNGDNLNNIRTETSRCSATKEGSKYLKDKTDEDETN
jgi:hypothetical protein